MMKNGLKIYACTGVGSLGIGATYENYDYWLDDTQTISNTIAVNSLLGKINALASDLRYNDSLTQEEALLELQMIDLYAVCLQAAKQYTGSELARFGAIIARYVDEGRFMYADMDNDKRNDYLENIYEEIEALFLSGENYSISNSFYEWFEEEIVSKNYCGLSEEKQKKLQAVLGKISGVGAASSKDPAGLLHDCGGYYLYMYLTEDNLKKLSPGDPIKIKYRKEKEMYDYVMKGYRELGGEEFAANLIESGIRDEYKHTPEYVIKTLTTAKGVGCGVTAALTAIITLINAIATLIGTLLGGILSIVSVVVEKKYAQPKDPDSGTPEGVDWEDEMDRKEKSKNIWLLALGALGLFWFLRK